MATLSRGYTFGSTEQVTSSKLHSLVDSGAVSNIATVDISNTAVTDEKINDVSGSKFKELNLTPSGAGLLPVANGGTGYSTTAGLLGLIYPVGIVITLGVSTNPATLFGFGTWTAIAGRVIVGIDGTQTEFDTLNETGGAKTHTLTITEMPSHSHSYTNSVSGFSASSLVRTGTDAISSGSTDNTGGGGAHNNLQPYIVKYVWERTA